MCIRTKRRREGKCLQLYTRLSKLCQMISLLFIAGQIQMYFVGKIVFRQKHSLGFPEHDVITKEIEGSGILTVCICLLWQSVSLNRTCQ